MQFVIRRSFTLVITVFVVTLLTFTVFHVIPGDPALLMLGTDADAEAVESLRQQLGVNKPILIQYIQWVANAVQGDFGNSIRLSQPVSSLISERLPLTGLLTFTSMILVILASLPLGTIAAVNRGKRLDFAIQSITQLGLAIPFFWAGIMLILLFSLKLRLLPPGGYVSFSENPVLAIKSLVLPAVALALPRIAIMTRVTRSAVMDVIGSEYILTAKGKGLSATSVLFKHVFRNAMIPVVTMLGIHTAGLLAGSIVAEEVFALPGLGRLLLAGIGYRDLPLIQGLVLTIALFVLTINFIVDLLYLWLEPRVHYQ